MKTTFPKDYECLSNMDYIANTQEEVLKLNYDIGKLVKLLSIRWKHN